VDEMMVQCRDPESIRWTTVPTPFERANAVSYIKEIVPGGWHTNRDLGFAVEAEHADGQRRFAGSMSLRPMDDGAAEIAFGLHPGARGRGVARRAVNLLLDWGFNQLNLDVVVWYANVDNWASWRVAWATGFSFHGTVESFLNQCGERRDAWCGSLRAAEPREPRHEWHVAPTLSSDRLRLRPFRPEDAPRIEEAVNDERTKEFVGTAPVIGQSGETFIRRQLEADAKGERYNWCIADRATDQLLGHIQLFGLSGLDKTAAELGYVVHRDARGKGVLTEALTLVTEWAFRRKEEGGMGGRRLFLGTAGTNKASRHAAEKAGYVHIGTHPEAFPTATGFDDEVVYHQLNPLWTE
jgi:RimJ/RimL family protein N-acetyltransferase